jgi:hypothetical protein
MSLVLLPLEILQQIAACIETVHRPSLFTFSLTSQACYRASVFLIFRQISVLVRNPGDLRRDADKLTEALSRMDAARHVQCLSIKGDIRCNVIKDNRHAEWLRGTGLDEILVDWDPVSYHRRYVIYDEPVIKRESDENLAWTPRARPILLMVGDAGVCVCGLGYEELVEGRIGKLIDGGEKGEKGEERRIGLIIHSHDIDLFYD